MSVACDRRVGFVLLRRVLGLLLISPAPDVRKRSPCCGIS
jgi:hypothetical protein